MRRMGLILAAVAILSTGPAAAAHRNPDALPATRIRDLHYGDVLFYYFQGPDRDLEALTRLSAYEHWNLVPHHEADAQLLLGGLYLDLGLHNEAGARFEKLLTPDVPIGVRNRAWFYLAEVWYARGYLDKAEQALAQVQGRLPVELEAEKQHLLSNALIDQGRYDDAIRLLEGWRGPRDWMAYGRYNLGIALVREHRLSDADRSLTAVGTLATRNPELIALRDRANLALGYAYLQANQPAAARPALERVRIAGPSSSQALLGMGWADAALGDYRGALVPWLELRRRSLMDSAVQESYLAVPYAYGKLGANGEAAQNYESALDSYVSENRALEAAIERVRAGRLLEPLLAAPSGAQYGWFWQLQNLPNAPESRYLYTILAGHDFQEGLKNYRDLTYMQRTLAEWAESMAAFADMIDARERAYAERIPRVDQLLASRAAERLQRRRNELQSRLDVIEREHDVAALGSPEERAHWAKVLQIQSALAAAPHDAANDALRDRLRVVKGVLYFEMDQAFKARVWQQRRTIRDLDLALSEAQERWIRVERARKNVPTNTGEFAARVAALRERIGTLETRLAAMRQKQSQYLAQLAVSELEAQKTRLAAYEVQARFELASMYDRASTEAAAAPSKPEAGKPGATSPPAGRTPAAPESGP
jgi:hypothetical protein